MIKKLAAVLLLTFAASLANAEEYSYVENPDPSKYIMKWEGPEPNCTDNVGGYEIKGWIKHPSDWSVPASIIVKLLLKDDPNVEICTIELKGNFSPRYNKNCTSIDTSNTHWITVEGYVDYRTWACG